MKKTVSKNPDMIFGCIQEKTREDTSVLLIAGSKNEDKRNQRENQKIKDRND